MTIRGFLKLSLILVLEIFIAHGLVFIEDFTAEIAEIRNIADFSEDRTPAVSFIRPVQEEQAFSSEGNNTQFEDTKEENEAPPGTGSGPVLQQQLTNVKDTPDTIRAVYLTSWSAGTPSRIEYVVNLARITGLNAVVIDVKDFSGEVAYVTNVAAVKTYGAERVKIRNIETLIDRLQAEGIYVIARMTVFQDPVLVRARPDLAVQSFVSEGVWADNKGLGWVDPASREVWEYTVAIARDAADRGFDEINFDYVRFPSDGNLQDMRFPVWDRQMPRREVIREFFAYMREQLEGVVISADLFGLTTSSRDDLGIGQVIEDAYEYFDYVYPMVYPSHYAKGYRGYANPAEHPYEVVHFSMAAAQTRLDALRAAYPERAFAKLRPWLQDFNLGAPYDPIMVQAQVRAAEEALGEEFAGFLLWAPTNWYTTSVLNPFLFDWNAYRARPISAS